VPEILMLPMAGSRSLLTIMPVFPRGQEPAGNAGNRQGSMRMAHSSVNRAGRKRTAARLRALRRRAAAWKRAARQAMTLAVVAGSLLGPVHESRAQMGMGQSGMGQAGGLMNGAVAQLQNGPGWFYYGINAADRGLGYLGSYMTAGGFIPVAEDDLGGLWSTDLRGHLSNYGGFFSNVGAVRKQFIGGSLLGVGVYWDYDGDQNQYSSTPILGTPYSFAGGQSYNQVGVSGEWLTDYGNLRSNGYIPVGTTAQLTGPFVGNSVLCQNGVNAALGGADLEVGAYIPGLSDWAGMMSVGGYAYGNTRYTFQDGTAAVPWFGGVYTRLDMTFIKNWDFSLQYNNDSYFDSTGFARLTYRMGGSRRRNVPDQVEQPMMRNEHIVRAHQTPEVAINPETGDPWKVFHVDNTAAVGGNGTAEAPFTTLTQAETAAVAAYDIVYVRVGNSPTMPYVTPVAGYTFGNQNQYLIGEGSTLEIPTVNCGPEALFVGANNGLYPVITNPIGPAIAVDQNGAVVSHFQITGSPVGISDGTGLAAPGTATISDVIIAGGAGIPQRGVLISNAGSTGAFNFDRLQIANLDDEGLVLTTAGGRANVTNSTFTDIGGSAVIVSGAGAVATVNTSTIDGTVGKTPGIDGTALLASGSGSGIILTSSTISNTTGDAIVAAGAASTIDATDFSITKTSASALVASGSGSTITGLRGSVITTGSDTAVVSGANATMSLAQTRLRNSSANGATVSGVGAELYLTGTSSIEAASIDGLQVNGNNNTVLVQDSSIVRSGNNGVTVRPGPGSASTQVTLLRADVNQTTGFAVSAESVNGANEVVQVFGSRITNAGAGISAAYSNLDIGRDPTKVNGVATSIQNTGSFGVSVFGNSLARVTNTAISGVGVGISADNSNVDNAGTVTELTATNNAISANDIGISIVASGPTDTLGQSRVIADIASNRISAGGTAGINLLTENPAAEGDPPVFVIQIDSAIGPSTLGAVNFNTDVLNTPTAPDQVLWQPFAPAPTLPPRPVPIVPTPP
jgi:hypothetical protein